VFSIMATRRNLTHGNIAELILELDFDAHALEDEDILLRVTVTQLTVLTQISHSQLSIQTVLLYL
jgi:hypothetical protein